MRTDYTIKELFENSVNANDVDIITIHNGFMTQQCDSVDEIMDSLMDSQVKDYDIEFDSDEGVVYLDIYCE
jgi:hypothetical protein